MVKHLSILLFFAIGTFALTKSAPGESSEPGAVNFDREVRPILSSKCFVCHGPEQTNRSSNLRLDTQAGLIADLGSYQAVVPRSPGDSELFRRVTSTDVDERMPPFNSEYQLSSQEVDVLRRWIEQGAVWTQHWSLVPIVRPNLPQVKQVDWVRTSIDRFVLSNLEAERLDPSPRVDRRTLLRRLALDLTGLPPSVSQVRRFLADESPAAYERQVDLLLNSSEFGEHMARFWLDAARYADTHGLHVDNYREIWPYRDWVIEAFNSNKPYDQFLVEQLAGDLLPDASLEAQSATGFNRCGVTTNEGGSIPEEVYVRNVVERVSALATSMMGLTFGCAVCHDHKFDAISQKDFFQLFAFFNSLDGQEFDGNTSHPPALCLRTDRRAI